MNEIYIYGGYIKKERKKERKKEGRKERKKERIYKEDLSGFERFHFLI